MKKVILDKSKCIGCGACVSVCFKYFELTEEGKSHLKGGKISPTNKNKKEELKVENLECIQDAIETCPFQAISVVEE